MGNRFSVDKVYRLLFTYLKGTLPANVDTVLITGGRGSGKSWVVALFLTIAMLVFRKIGILFSRYTLTSAGQSIIPEFQDKIGLLKAQESLRAVKKDYTDMIEGTNGSRTIFKGIKTGSGNQTASLKSLKNIAIWVLDEAEELIYEDVYDKIQLSIRSNEYQNLSILILNPTHKQHFIYKRFFKKTGIMPGFCGIHGNVLYIHSTFKNNNHLPPNILALYEKMRVEDEKKYKHIVLGGWLDQAEGLIFSNFLPLDVRPKNTELQLIGYGMDFGFTQDPTALVALYKYPNGGRNSIFAETLIFETNLTNNSISDMAISLGVNSGAYVVADSAEQKSIAEINSFSSGRLMIIPATKGAGSVQAGISKIKDHKFSYLSGDPIGAEVNEYCYIRDKNTGEWTNEPIDKYNHTLDAIRYCITKLLYQ